MLDAPYAAMCKPVACVFGFDVVGTVAGGAITGAITGAVAILVFLLTRRWMDGRMRRDWADVLLTEINAIVSQVQPRILGIRASESYYIGAYDGLHKSGNIRYIPSSLHPNLARFYGQYASGGSEAVDMDAAVAICARLESAVRGNRGHWKKIVGLGR